MRHEVSSSRHLKKILTKRRGKRRGKCETKLTNIVYNQIPAMHDEVLELLKKSEAIFTGHFVYTSGKHAPRYLNKMALFAHPIYASEMGKLFAKKYKDQN